MLEEAVKMETSEGRERPFDEETPAKRDKEGGSESPKRARKMTTAEERGPGEKKEEAIGATDRV